jgi:hypothetical protein
MRSGLHSPQEHIDAIRRFREAIADVPGAEFLDS